MSPTTSPAPAPPRYSMSADRAVAALQRLRPAFSGDAEISMSASIIPSASCWSDGSICLSTGLLRIADDDELTAAIAHELGHLTSSVATGQTHALGGGSNEEIEQRADAFAVGLLRKSGISPGALARVLTTVRDAPQTRRELRPAITRRIALLPVD